MTHHIVIFLIITLLFSGLLYVASSINEHFDNKNKPNHFTNDSKKDSSFTPTRETRSTLMYKQQPHSKHKTNKQ